LQEQTGVILLMHKSKRKATALRLVCAIGKRYGDAACLMHISLKNRI